MERYDTSPWASSDYILGYASGRISEDPETLEHWATRIARLVYAGAVDFFVGWDCLWWAAVRAGVPQIEAQRRIGEVFASARQGEEPGAPGLLVEYEVCDAPTQNGALCTTATLQ